ncbi:hypothetical protein [Curtobacterium sp. Leaf261]|uniref:hypothetical protein n=1 Tax=Curtobacterium sp. Leaf261 TaxID=1736311 RepID=UPI0006FBC9ED|nr:hypothetical protein [Curtobacterium sp. Leaf261]KQO59958.1 hypothetical protein ASF23_14995 [Curtobacterium sp. Leaf261]
MTRVAAPFAIVVPPGWARIPAREEDERERDAVIDAIIAAGIPDTLPADSVGPWRHELRKRLTGMVADAGESGATACYIPTQSVDGFTPAASIVETEVEDETEESATDVVTQILLDAGQLQDGIREVDGAIAARTDTTIRRVRVMDDLPDLDDRQVVYTVSVPHRPGTWVMLSFSAVSAPEADPRLTDALVMLFDAIMSTFRFVEVPDTEPSDVERRVGELLDGADR